VNRLSLHERLVMPWVDWTGIGLVLLLIMLAALLWIWWYEADRR
jgi:hypothetical protein